MPGQEADADRQLTISEISEQFGSSRTGIYCALPCGLRPQIIGFDGRRPGRAFFYCDSYALPLLGGSPLAGSKRRVRHAGHGTSAWLSGVDCLGIPVASGSPSAEENRRRTRDWPQRRSRMDLVLVRVLFVIILAAICYHLQPFNLDRPFAAGAGVILALGVIVFEDRLRRVSLKRLIGAAIGSILGIFGAYLFSLVIHSSIPTGNTQHFFELFVMLLMAYVGLIVGANKGDLLNLSALGGVFGGEKQGKRSYKILDTSVIIDGRIADIAETGFLDGVVVIPQFVLRELQLVADSADSLKRNRGRRGLDVLQRLQKIARLTVQIVEDDYPSIREVDMKLIELAKQYESKIITNDLNLNKVAQLQGVEVLNINELANSLKPIVLPGETMKVFILKEGKEYNQGVAYLDDGTMVVVDNARKMIGKTIDISVTSVLQTTAGKMIFGKWDERAAVMQPRPADPRPELRKPAPAVVPEIPKTD